VTVKSQNCGCKRKSKIIAMLQASLSRLNSVETHNALSIEWVIIKGIRCLKFTFSGLLSCQTATRKVEEWRRVFDAEAGTKVTLVFDCKEMTDYEPFARIVFQKAIAELKPQINGIWVISTSKVIIAGAAIMGLFASFPIKTVASTELIETS
jgi:hypothetical protein